VTNTITQNDQHPNSKQLYLYSVSLLMRRGPHRVAVGLRDEVGADASFITGSVVVGK
jgi:hypothetical protein